MPKRRHYNLPECLTQHLLVPERRPREVDVYVSSAMKHALMPIRQVLGHSLHGICQYALDFAEHARLAEYDKKQFHLRKLVPRGENGRKQPYFAPVKRVMQMEPLKFFTSCDGADILRGLALSEALLSDYHFMPTSLDDPPPPANLDLVKDEAEREIYRRNYQSILEEWKAERETFLLIMPDAIATALVRWFVPYGRAIIRETNCEVGPFDPKTGFDPMPRFARNIT